MKQIKWMMLSTFILGGFVLNSSIDVSAEDATSNATISAVAGTKTISPVNPINPTQPGDNPTDEGNMTGQTGPLQINYVSHLKFGDQVEITSPLVKASLKNEYTPYFQISDLRGTGAGWSLNVNLSDFKSEDGAKTIKGAQIIFSDGVVRTSNPNMENAATANDLTLDAGSMSYKPMMKASAGNGRGTWLTSYDKMEGTADNNKVMFEAPTNSIDADVQYNATLTWQLVDSPQI